MIEIFLYIALSCFSTFAAVYGLYLLIVLRTSKTKEYLKILNESLKKEINIQELPTISIIIPAHNEEDVIVNKFHNIAAFDYPKEKLEVILVDDCSVDHTAEKAAQALKEFNMTGKVIRNKENMGVNASYNLAIREANGVLILMTDADVMIRSDALIKGAKILESQEDIGGVTGKTVIASSNDGVAFSIESSYTDFMNNYSLTESAIDSTYPGSTCLALVKKSALSPLNEKYGSSDGNLSLSMIIKGYRYIFVPQLVFQENTASNIREQRRQKVRRATRLLQSTFLYSKKIFVNSKNGFARIVFPLRFLMTAICPILFWVGLASLVVFIATLSPVLVVLVLGVFSLFLIPCMVIFLKFRNLLLTFLAYQIYLMLAIILVSRKAKTWKTIQRDTGVLVSDLKNDR
jgi:cellulose synthase/poly-beta-1,6-N-acetylglucosamine synthase-like glycosyltransferase